MVAYMGLWSEKVVKVCNERYCIKLIWKMISEAKTKSTVVKLLFYCLVPLISMTYKVESNTSHNCLERHLSCSSES